jgi:hypothetical protein
MTALETSRGAEEDVVSSRRLWLVAGASVAIGALAVAGAGALLRGWSPSRSEKAELSVPGGVRGPVEQSLILTTERGLDAREEQRRSLNQYRIIDPVSGIAQIPIDVAMHLVADPDFRERARERESAVSAAPRGK